MTHPTTIPNFMDIEHEETVFDKHIEKPDYKELKQAYKVLESNLICNDKNKCDETE